MHARRLTVAAIFAVTVVLTLALSWLALESTKLATGGLVGLVGLTVIFIQPFVGLINYLLFLYIRPQDYVPALMGLPIMLMIGTASFGLFVLHLAVIKRQLAFTRAPQNTFVLMLYAAIIVSQLLTLLPSGVIKALTDFSSTLILYLLIANLVVTRRRFAIVVNLLVILTIVLAAQGIVQHFTGKGFGGMESYEGRIRAVGIFADPNDLGLALVMVLPFVVLKLMEPSPLWEKPLALIALVVLVYALYLTQSRGGQLAFGALMMMLLSRRFGRIIGYGGGGLVLMALFVLGPRMGTISTEEGSAYGRIEAWSTGIDLFQAYPLFGVGFGNYTEYHFRTAHNSLVLCAAELGIVGLYAWIMMIYISIKNDQFIARQLREAKSADFALYVDSVRYGLIAFCMAAYFLSRTYNELLYILVGLSTAATHMFVKASGEKYALIEKRDYVIGLMIAVGGLVVTKAFVIMAW